MYDWQLPYTHSDLLASNDQLFDIFMYNTNPEMWNLLTVSDTVNKAILFCALQQGHLLIGVTKWLIFLKI
jgi:hypothetical protein